ncbi:MAG: ester cyclase [Pseudomonadota bacterium]
MATAGEVVREACQVIWSEGRVDRVAEFYSEDFRADYPMTDWGAGLAGVAALAENVRKGMPDYTEHIEELIEADDEVVVRLRITGTHTPTGTAVSFRDVTMLTVRDGRICFQRGLTDYMSLYAQLGLVEIPGG